MQFINEMPLSGTCPLSAAKVESDKVHTLHCDVDGVGYSDLFSRPTWCV